MRTPAMVVSRALPISSELALSSAAPAAGAAGAGVAAAGASPPLQQKHSQAGP